MKIENRSGLIPKGQAVVLLPYEPDLKTTKIAIPDSYREHLRMIENRGVVIAIGPESWRGEAAPRAVIGEKVMFSKHAGAKAIGVDGRSYRVVNADDIFLGIDDGMSLEQIFPELSKDTGLPVAWGERLLAAASGDGKVPTDYGNDTETNIVSYGEPR